MSERDEALYALEQFTAGFRDGLKEGAKKPMRRAAVLEMLEELCGSIRALKSSPPSGNTCDRCESLGARNQIFRDLLTEALKKGISARWADDVREALDAGSVPSGNVVLTREGVTLLRKFVSGELTTYEDEKRALSLLGESGGEK